MKLKILFFFLMVLIYSCSAQMKNMTWAWNFDSTDSMVKDSLIKEVNIKFVTNPDSITLANMTVDWYSLPIRATIPWPDTSYTLKWFHNNWYIKGAARAVSVFGDTSVYGISRVYKVQASIPNPPDKIHKEK